MVEELEFSVMEELKSLPEILQPDERSKFFSNNSLSSRHSAISSIKLSSSVPEDIRSQFNVALMLSVYAWLYYPFHQVSELKAFSTLEMALRWKLPNNKGGLKKLLSLAIDTGLIVDKGFSHICTSGDSLNEYSTKLPDIISDLRNDLAHGSSTLHPQSLFTLRNCSEIINQLFICEEPV